MKKSLITLLVLSLLLLAACGNSDYTNVQFTDGSNVNCMIADTEREHITGLSNHETLAENEGMIFTYPEPRLGVSFWMPARMNFDIDILFLDEEKKIVKIFRKVKPCKSNDPTDCPDYGAPHQMVKFVVEVVAGYSDKHGIKVGDTLKFEL